MKIINLIYILIFVFWELSAQNYRVNNFTRNDGLPHVQIFSLYQDSRDYLWIGTGGGLSMFDGRSFKNFYLTDGLPANHFFHITESEEKIWVAGFNGLTSIDLKPEGKYGITTLPNSKIPYEIFALQKIDDQFFIGTRGNGLFVYKNKQLIPHTVNNQIENTSASRVLHSEQSIWISFIDAALVQLTRKGDIFKIHKNPIFNKIRDFQIIDNDNFMILTEQQVFLYNYKTEEISNLVNLKEKYSKVVFYTFKYYRNAFYITSNIGFFIIENTDIQHLTIKDGLLTNTVSSLFIDREENIWIGSDSYGLNQLISPNIRNYTKQNGLMNPSINAVQNYKDRLFIGTDEGVYTLKDENIIVESMFEFLKTETIWDIYISQDNSIWISTEQDLIKIKENSTPTRISAIENTVVLNIEESENGDLWFCSTDGLFRYSNGFTVEVSTFKNNVMGQVWDMIEDTDRLIFAAQNGLFFVDKSNLSQINSLNSSIKDLYCLYRNNDRDFYFGSESGLYRFQNGQISDLKHIGLNGQIISNIFKNVNGDLWVANENGIDLFDGTSIIEHMDENDGLSGSEITTNNAVIEYNDRYYIGFFGGLSEFQYVNQIKVVQPNVYINGAEASNDSVTIDLISNDVQIPYNYNQINFSFNTPWLKSADDITYLCYLEGFERPWKNAIKQGSITYNNLEYGDYTFFVKSLNHNKIESQNIASIRFSINRPIWYNPYFILLSIFILLVLGFWLFKVYMYRINRKNIELEKRVRLRTKELLKAKEYIEQIVEFAAIVIVTVDKKGKIVSWNKQGEFVFGYLKKEIIDKNIKILDLVNDEFSFLEIFKKIDDESFVSEIEITKQRSNGSKVYLLFSASLIMNSNNEKTGYTLIFSDISQQKELQAKKDIQQKMIGGIDALNQLLGTMSHHINNSVASILSIVQLYEESQQFEDKVVEITKEHTGRINAVIQSLKVLVSSLNLKTKNYAGSEDQVFDIDEDIKEFNQKFMELPKSEAKSE